MEKLIGSHSVSRETRDDLKHFEDIVLKWTKRINLISANTVSDIWLRHILDSSQIYPIAPQPFEHWVDIGSGGGFPGIVMAIIARNDAPDARFTLVESDQRKATFLRTAIRELNLNAQVHATRAEELSPQGADIVSARALTALSSLLPLLKQHMGPTAVAILHKGRQYEKEIADARASWRFDLEDRASLTDPDARILCIKGISNLD